MEKNIINEITRIKNLMSVNEATIPPRITAIVRSLKLAGLIDRADEALLMGIRTMDDLFPALSSISRKITKPSEYNNFVDDILTNMGDPNTLSNFKTILRDVESGSMEKTGAINALDDITTDPNLKNMLSKRISNIDTYHPSVALNTLKKAHPNVKQGVWDAVTAFERQIEGKPFTEQFSILKREMDNAIRAQSDNNAKIFKDRTEKSKLLLNTFLPFLKKGMKYGVYLIVVSALACNVKSLMDGVINLFGGGFDDNKFAQLIKRYCKTSEDGNGNSGNGNSGNGNSGNGNSGSQETTPKKSNKVNPRK